jgi:hypothetical protein
MRIGVVTGVVGRLLRIRWATGEETTVAPGPGSVAVVSKGKGSSSKKAVAPAKSTKAPAKKTAKKATKAAPKAVKASAPAKKPAR